MEQLILTDTSRTFFLCSSQVRLCLCTCWSGASLFAYGIIWQKLLTRCYAENDGIWQIPITKMDHITVIIRQILMAVGMHYNHTNRNTVLLNFIKIYWTGIKIWLQTGKFNWQRDRQYHFNNIPLPLNGECGGEFEKVWRMKMVLIV